MVFDSDPEITYRPILSAVRGAAITLFAFVAFFLASGVDRMQHAWPYIGAIALAFVLHYISAWLTVRGMRRRYHEKHQGKGNALGTKGQRRPADVIGNRRQGDEDRHGGDPRGVAADGKDPAAKSLGSGVARPVGTQ